jgi:hypothetical protein
MPALDTQKGGEINKVSDNITPQKEAKTAVKMVFNFFHLLFLM